MRWNRGYGNDRWRRWRGQDGRSTVTEELVDLALQGGLWFASCLAVSSLAPALLAPVLLRELLTMAAFAVAAVGLWRGESLTLERFNNHDLALGLLALGLIAGLFIDPSAAEALARAQNAGAAAAA